jgi:hypothetical protein
VRVEAALAAAKLPLAVSNQVEADLGFILMAMVLGTSMNLQPF